MAEQASLGMEDTQNLDSVEKYKFDPIKGYPMLHWHGKRPFTSTQYYPAQKKEVYGESVNDWMNKIFWGDNLQVMSHLLKEYRGKVDLIYIDPPFDSKADYKKVIKLKSKTVSNDHSSFEEKQYTDVWSNDSYLQFLYERIILLKELLSDTGSIYVHCDYQKSHYIRLILDEVFGQKNLVNELIWRRKQATSYASKQFGVTTDTLFWYSKSSVFTFNPIYSKHDDNTQNYIKERFVYDDGDGRKYMKSPLVNSLYRPNLRYEFHGVNPPPNGWLYKQERLEELFLKNELVMPSHPDGRIYRKIYEDEYKGQLIQNIWLDIPIVNPMASERENYPTQKPEALLKRIIEVSSSPGDIVFDCFMGSGTTQAAAMKLGRRFIGADINLGAIQTTTKRLIKVADEVRQAELDEENPKYTSFEVYNVNNYDVFRNPVEAKSLLLEALEIEPTSGTIYDGVKDGYQVKVMPVNRIATREDLNELIANFPYKVFDQRKVEAPNKPVESVMLICMGHEPDLKAHLIQESGYKLDVQVVDVLRDKANIQFKRDSEAKIATTDGQLVVENFYPMNLLQKLSLQKETVSEWRELVESIVIDWNYDGSAMEPTVLDIPAKDEFVVGEYDIPADAGTIKIKITDLLSESYEEVVQYG